MRVLPTVLVYCGFFLAFVSLVILVRPLGALTRTHGWVLGLAALVLVFTGMLWPARETRVSAARTRLDEFIPRYQFSEFHQLRVRAQPAEAMRAINAVTAEEIRFFKTLIAIRRGGRSGPESILNPSAGTSIIDVATRTTFILLARDSNEIVLGTTVVTPRGGQSARTAAEFKSPPGPGYANAAMNFRVQPDGDGTLVTTETRVFANDDGSRRRFAPYWRVIYPGSALIRRSWLRAIQKRVES